MFSSLRLSTTYVSPNVSLPWKRKKKVMKIGTQRPPAQDPSPSTQQPPPPRNHTADAAELHAQREPVPPPPRVSLDPARPRDATAQPSPSREPSPQAPPEPSSPVPPAHLDTAAQSDDVDPRDYAADSPTAILRHINAAYPPIIHYTLHIGMLVKDLHERIGELLVSYFRYPTFPSLKE